MAASAGAGPGVRVQPERGCRGAARQRSSEAARRAEQKQTIAELHPQVSPTLHAARCTLDKLHAAPRGAGGRDEQGRGLDTEPPSERDTLTPPAPPPPLPLPCGSPGTRSSARPGMLAGSQRGSRFHIAHLITVLTHDIEIILFQIKPTVNNNNSDKAAP